MSSSSSSSRSVGSAIVFAARIAWRNVWRSPRRTLLNMSAIAVGLVLVLIFGGLVRRMLSEARDQLDNTGIGHVEVTSAAWRKTHGAAAVLPSSTIVPTTVASTDTHALRLQARGLLVSTTNSTPVEVHGVDVHIEQQVAAYLRDIRSGSLEALSDPGVGVVVGDVLARKLQLQVGDALTLLLVDTHGARQSVSAHVVATYHALSSKIAEHRIIMTRSALAAALALPANSAHQLVVRLSDPRRADEVAAAIAPVIDGVDIKVETWRQVVPALAQMEQLIDTVMTGMSFFVYLLIGLGILNTMWMSVLERTREFGVLMALGTRPGSILTLLLAESFIVATLSVVVGLAVGVPIAVLGQDGLLDYSKEMGEGIDLGGTVMRARMGTELSWATVLPPTLFVYVMALFVGLIPAWRITRKHITDALRAR